jgi:hypothetical protein
MILEKQVECRLAGETEVLGENLPQRHFCPSQNPTCPHPGLNQGHRNKFKPFTKKESRNFRHVETDISKYNLQLTMKKEWLAFCFIA